MIFQERTYAVLLVSSSEKFFDAMRSQLPGSQYWPVDTVGSGGAARRSLLEREYDLILINAPLKDGSGTQFTIDCCEKTASGVLLFVRNDLMEEVAAQGTEYGVLVIAKPTPALLAAQSLHMACAMRERLLRLLEKQRSVEEQISEMRLVNRAKWLLIENRGMTEEAAHRTVEKQAMDERISKREAAQRIIRMFE